MVDTKEILKERAEALVEQALPVVEALIQEGWGKVEAAEREVFDNLDRLAGLLAEHEAAAARVGEIRADLAAAPERLAKAALDEDGEAEARIKAHYREAKAELAGLEEQQRRLEEEIEDLRGPRASLPTLAGHEADAELHQRGRIGEALLAAAGPLHTLDRLARIVRGALHDLEARAEDNRAMKAELRRHVTHDARVREYRQKKEQAARAERS